MLKQEHPLQSKGLDAAIEDELQHVLIPACELGPELYRQFRAAKPHWQPKSCMNGGDECAKKTCESCRECLSTSKPANVKPHLTVECSGMSKMARPISISFSNVNQHTKMPAAENTASYQALQSPVVIKATQHYANKGAAADENALSKPLHTKPAGREVSMSEETGQTIKLKIGEDYGEHADPARMKASDLSIIPTTMSEHATSSEDLSESTMTPPQMEAVSFSDHAVGVSHGDALAMAKASKYANNTPVRVDEPVMVDNQALFDYVVATRKIPYGHSFSNLDSNMQRKLHLHFKNSCPPCPHCNCNTYVKFRYFNNSGKSSLLQPRYTCRNPDTCLTVQEKSGKAGSRDFTLPRPRDAETHRALPGSGSHQVANSLQGRTVRQPQMIPRSGSKRSAHDLNSPSDAGERGAKLPNTTLSLQTLNGSAGHVIDAASLQIVESSKARSLQLVKPAEDSNSSSSTRTASDEHTGINVRCRAETSTENGRLVVQPISVQKVAPGKVETGTNDRASKGGKIAEFNICMYIDLSATSSC
eukprot:c16674_g1_i1 orf=364-1962(-)